VQTRFTIRVITGSEPSSPASLRMARDGLRCTMIPVHCVQTLTIGGHNRMNHSDKSSASTSATRFYRQYNLHSGLGHSVSEGRLDSEVGLAVGGTISETTARKTSVRWQIAEALACALKKENSKRFQNTLFQAFLKCHNSAAAQHVWS
jgi:hypothetical protein